MQAKETPPLDASAGNYSLRIETMRPTGNYSSEELIVKDKFGEFWEKYRGTFSGCADDGQIEEVTEQVAFAAWCEAQRQVVNYAKSDAQSNAFPGNRDVQFWGLTKREYLAAKALQGLLASAPGLVEAIALGSPDIAREHAKASVVLADELIKALNKNP